MAANQPKLNGKEKKETTRQNPTQLDAIVLLDRDHTVVDDAGQATDPRLATFFTYCITKKIPIGFVSTGASIAGYGGDERLVAIRAMYPIDNQPGYLIARGMKSLDESYLGLAGALQLKTVSIRPIQEDSGLLDISSEILERLLVRGMEAGKYNAETHELSFTEDKMKASFTVKINPQHTFNIQLRDKENNPGLVLTINVHELLLGGYEEIGAAKGKIYGCMQVLTDMHILPILDREMKTAGIIAIQGPDDYSRVNISRVAMVDDEDVIVQNLGRAGLHTILADTESRYNSLSRDPKQKNEQHEGAIKALQDKIKNAAIENEKYQLLKDSQNLMQVVAQIYKQQIAHDAEAIKDMLQELKNKSAALRQLDPIRLVCDADSLDRHITYLENFRDQPNVDHSDKIKCAENDVERLGGRALNFYVDEQKVTEEISRKCELIEKNRLELERLKNARPEVFSTFIDGLAQHLGFSSFAHLAVTSYRLEFNLNETLKRKVYEMLNSHATEYVEINEENIRKERGAKTALLTTTLSTAFSFFGQEESSCDEALFKVAKKINSLSSVEDILSYIIMEEEAELAKKNPSIDFMAALSEIKIATLHVKINFTDALPDMVKILEYAVAQIAKLDDNGGSENQKAQWKELAKHAKENLNVLLQTAPSSSISDGFISPNSSSNSSSSNSPSSSSNSSTPDSPSNLANSSHLPATREEKFQYLKNFLVGQFNFQTEEGLRRNLMTAPSWSAIEPQLIDYYFDNNLDSDKASSNGRTDPQFWKEIFETIDKIYHLPQGHTAAAIMDVAQERQKAEQQNQSFSRNIR